MTARQRFGVSVRVDPIRGSIYARIICAGLVLIGGLAVFSGAAHAQADPAAPQAVAAQEQEPARIPAGDLDEPEQVLTGQDLIDDTFPGSWPMFDTDFRAARHGLSKSNGTVPNLISQKEKPKYETLLTLPCGESKTPQDSLL